LKLTELLDCLDNRQLVSSNSLAISRLMRSSTDHFFTTLLKQKPALLQNPLSFG
jgi:hypothetical protein